MKLPKYSYLFFISKQPSQESWDALQLFADEWNKLGKSQFGFDNSVGESMLAIEFEHYNSSEKIEFDEKLSELNKLHPFSLLTGIVDNRVNEDFIGSDFVQLGEQFYDENKFFTNWKKILVENKPCTQCGRYVANLLQLKGTPIVDTSFLDKEMEPNTNFSPLGIDFIGTPEGGTMVSNKVKQLIENSGATGAKFLPVIDKSTKKISERIFLLATEKSITDFCPEHTPRAANAICKTCGTFIGEVYGYRYVPANWLNGDEIFSMSPHGLSK